MSRSMSSPWLQATMVHMIAPSPEYHQSSSSGSSSVSPGVWLKPRVVQVVRGNDEARMLEVSDKESTIVVMLTEKCCATFTRMHSNMRLASLRNFIVKLDEWHVSTVMQAAGDREMTKIRDLKISFPLSLQCRRLTLLGASDVTLAGEPLDVNRSRAVRAAMADTSYLTLTARLKDRQFPAEVSLPDAAGLFSVPSAVSDRHPLSRSQCIVGRAEQEELERQAARLHVSLFDKSDALLAQHGRSEAVGRREVETADSDSYSLLSTPEEAEGEMRGARTGSSSPVASRLRSSRVIIAPSYPVKIRRSNPPPLPPSAPPARDDVRREAVAETATRASLTSSVTSGSSSGSSDNNLAEALSSQALSLTDASSWFTQPLNDGLIAEIEGLIGASAAISGQQQQAPTAKSVHLESNVSLKVTGSVDSHVGSATEGATGPDHPHRPLAPRDKALLGRAVLRRDKNGANVRGRVVSRQGAVGNRSRLVVRFDDGRVESLAISSVLRILLPASDVESAGVQGDASVPLHSDTRTGASISREVAEQHWGEENAFSRSLSRLLHDPIRKGHHHILGKNKEAAFTVSASGSAQTGGASSQGAAAPPEPPVSTTAIAATHIAAAPRAVVSVAEELQKRKRQRRGVDIVDGGGGGVDIAAAPMGHRGGDSRPPTSAFAKALGLLMKEGGTAATVPGEGRVSGHTPSAGTTSRRRAGFATSYFE